jgi:hypothetical protein
MMVVSAYFVGKVALVQEASVGLSKTILGAASRVVASGSSIQFMPLGGIVLDNAVIQKQGESYAGPPVDVVIRSIVESVAVQLDIVAFYTFVIFSVASLIIFVIHRFALILWEEA